MDVVALSAGFMSGNYGRVEVDGEVVFEMTGRGIGVVVINLADGKVVDSSCFDTHASHEEAEQLARYVLSQRTDDIIVAVVKDDASEK